MSKSKKVEITGEITGVRETWPLQLTINVKSEHYCVALQNDTAIYFDSKPATADELCPGMSVKITGVTSESETRLIAQIIEIL